MTSGSPFLDWAEDHKRLLAEILVAVILVVIIGWQGFHIKLLKATMKNAVTTISNYESAAQANLDTIDKLRGANKDFADIAEQSIKIAEEQVKLSVEREKRLKAREQTLKVKLGEALEQNKAYADSLVPDAVADQLRENSRQDRDR